METPRGIRFDPQPVTLEGENVRLVPLANEHAEGLFESSRDESIWTYISSPQFKTIEELRGWILQAQEELRASVTVPFTIFHKGDGRIAGATRYMDIRHVHRGLEIGWTWLDPAYQRTAINTESKFLLLCHAFEELGAIRVQLKTDLRNVRSQRAIERLGALREGVLRHHYLLWNGYIRDTVMYSVTQTEWPAVKARLQSFLER